MFNSQREGPLHGEMSKRKVTEIDVSGTCANAGFDRTFYFDKVCANLWGKIGGRVKD